MCGSMMLGLLSNSRKLVEKLNSKKERERYQELNILKIEVPFEVIALQHPCEKLLWVFWRKCSAAFRTIQFPHDTKFPFLRPQ